MVYRSREAEVFPLPAAARRRIIIGIGRLGGRERVSLPFYIDQG